MTVRHVTLSDGTPGIVRAIVPSDGSALTNALEELGPGSRVRRFLHDKKSLTQSEIELLSNPDGIDHIAYGLAVDLEGEFTPIAVARCFRDPEDGTMAEIAMVTADAWQGTGAGSELMCSISAAAYEVGIRYWRAVMFADNHAMKRLLGRFGRECHVRNLGNGVIEAIYEIVEPEGGFRNMQIIP